jgi:hypothetical protein
MSQLKIVEQHDKIHFIMKNGFEVFPKIRFKDGVNVFAVCVVDKKRMVFEKLETIGEYKHTSKTLNTAIESTVNHIYEKLTLHKVKTK